MSRRHAAASGAGQGGLAVTKVLLGLALGAGVVAGAVRVTTWTPLPDAPVEVATSVVAQTPARDAEPRAAADTPNVAEGDPFAGVDVQTNSVLSHIAGIEDRAKRRTPEPVRRTPTAAPTPAPAITVPAPAAAPVTVAPVTAGPVAATPARALRPVGVAAQPVAPAPQPAAVETPRAVPAAAPAQAASATPLARPTLDTVASSTDVATKSQATTPAAAAPVAPLAALDRGATAALGDPAQAIAAPLRVIERQMPEFPADALRAGVRNGRVVARLSIAPDGSVTATEVLSASPSGLFERESRRALARWRYEAPGRPATADVELVFTRD